MELWVYPDADAINTIVQSGSIINGLTILTSGSKYMGVSGTFEIVNIQNESWGYVYSSGYSGVFIHSCEVAASGSAALFAGQVARVITILEGGHLEVFSKGSAGTVTVSSGA